MLQNKKFLGKISEQFIRAKSKPLIAEVNENKKDIDRDQSNKTRDLK